MNSIFLDNPIDHRLVWQDGVAFCTDEELSMVITVQGEYFYPPIPQEAVMATITNPAGALASFRLAYPDKNWIGVGPDFPPEDQDLEFGKSGVIF